MGKHGYKSKAQGKKPDPYYYSTPWRKLRTRYIKDNPLCEMCLAQGKLKVAQIVDHIKEISDGGDRLSVDNLQSLCSGCHNTKTAAVQRKRKTKMPDVPDPPRESPWG